MTDKYISESHGCSNQEAGSYLDRVLADIDNKFMQRKNGSRTPSSPTSEKQMQKCKRSILHKLGNILFYGVMLTALIGGIFYGIGGLSDKSAGTGSRNIFGLSIMRVLSDSMESAYPKGSLVFCRQAQPENIKIGDDITFLTSGETTVTHRVIGIYENYEDSGQRGFETKGIENTLPDDEIVYAENVVGKVVWHLPGMDGTFAYIKGNWLFIVLPLAALVGMVIALKMLFSKNNDTDDGDKGVDIKKMITTEV